MMNTCSIKNVVKNAIICSYLASAAAGHATLPGLSPAVTPARACATVLHAERRMPAVNQSLILFNDKRNYNAIQLERSIIFNSCSEHLPQFNIYIHNNTI